MLAVCGATLILAGCVIIPAPRCTNVYYGKPGINVRELAPADKNIADGSVIAYGRITVPEANDQGTISARLIQYDSSTDSSAKPYGEEIVWFKPDGRFFWILPAGRYVIQPLYFNYAYSGESYRKKAILNSTLEFTLPEEAEAVYLGTVNVTLSPEYELLSITISTAEDMQGVELPSWSFAHDIPVSELMIIENPDLPRLEVRRRELCRKWETGLCIVTVGGGGCARN